MESARAFYHAFPRLEFDCDVQEDGDIQTNEIDETPRFLLRRFIVDETLCARLYVALQAVRDEVKREREGVSA